QLIEREAEPEQAQVKTRHTNRVACQLAIHPRLDDRPQPLIEVVRSDEERCHKQRERDQDPSPPSNSANRPARAERTPRSRWPGIRWRRQPRKSARHGLGMFLSIEVHGGEPPAIENEVRWRRESHPCKSRAHRGAHWVLPHGRPLRSLM